MTSPAQPPSAQHPPDEAAPATASRRVRIWDIILTGVILLVDVLLTVIAAVFGLYLAETVNVCGVKDCDTVLVAVGMALATVLPWILLAAAVIGSILLLVKRRVAFWVPLVCGVLIFIVWFTGGGLATWGTYTG